MVAAADTQCAATGRKAGCWLLAADSPLQPRPGPGPAPIIMMMKNVLLAREKTYLLTTCDQ